MDGATKQSGYALKRQQSENGALRIHERALETRMAIIHAARKVMLENGYAAARVEDVITAAGVSRPTFYRHFKDKFDVAQAYHDLARDEVSGPWSRLAEMDYTDPQDVQKWLSGLLDTFMERKDELVVWAEMSSAEPDYLLRMPRQMPDIIAGLSETIPAFAKAYSQAPYLQPDGKMGEPGHLWVEAYMMLEQLIYSFTSIAIQRQHPIQTGLIIRCFTDRVLEFIKRH